MSLITFALSIGLFVTVLYKFLTEKRGRPTPPGPKGYPIIGVSDSDLLWCSGWLQIITFKNVADMPTEQEWLTYAEWGRKWGRLLLYFAKQFSSWMILQVELFKLHFSDSH